METLNRCHPVKYFQCPFERTPSYIAGVCCKAASAVF